MAKKEIKNTTKLTPEQIVKGKIANALTSAAKDHIVATTDDLYDTNFQEYQDEINKTHVSGLTELSGTVVNIQDRVDTNEKNINALHSGLTEVQNLIPNEATSENKLVDKQYLLDNYYTTGKTDELLSEKQDVIDDLETIRSGATLGSTALQSVPAEYVTDTELASALTEYATTSALTAGLATKQDIINDLDEIRSGATLGSTALQEIPSEYVTETEMNSALTEYVTETELNVELSDLVASESATTIPDLDIYVQSAIPVIDKTSDTGTTFSIRPNAMYMFGTRTSLTITLASGSTGIVNEYMFQFTSGNVATALNVPSTVTWLKEPVIQTNKKYAVSIENNMGIIGEWSNE